MMATIEHRPEELNQIFARYAGAPPPVNDEKVQSDRSEWTQADKDLCAKIAESAQGEAFQKLFAGNIEAYGNDSSKADYAQCRILANFSADSQQIDRIIRKSKGFRDKWDSKRGSSTYGLETIKRAIADQPPPIDFTAFKANMDQKFAALVSDRQSTEEGAKGVNRFKLYTDDELATLPPMQWIIKSVLPDKGLGVLFGPSGSGKSFVALDMVQAVAAGPDWFGHKVKPCKVIYAALEGEGGIAGRVKAYRIKHGKTAENIHYLIQPFNLLNPGDVVELANAIKAVGGAEVVFIDTLNRAAPGADENSSADMGKIIQAAKELQTLIGGLVVFVHHTGKDASKGLRGHSSLHAALDGAIEVKRNGDNSREWIIAKSKDGKDGSSYQFRLEVVPLGVDEDGDEITSCVIKAAEDIEPQHFKPLTDPQNLGLRAFNEAVEKNGMLDDKGNFNGLHLEAWRLRFYSLSTADNQDAKKKAFQRVRNDLIKLGRLSVNNDIYRLQGLHSGTLEADIAKRLKATGTGDTDGT